MHIVQIVMTDRDYAAELEALLVRDGCHCVVLRNAPDFASCGVVVIDLEHFVHLTPTTVRPDQIVLIAGREESSLVRAWNAGLQTVVYHDEPPQTTLLAVMATELRLCSEEDVPSH